MAPVCDSEYTSASHYVMPKCWWPNTSQFALPCRRYPVLLMVAAPVPLCCTIAVAAEGQYNMEVLALPTTCGWYTQYTSYGSVIWVIRGALPKSLGMAQNLTVGWPCSELLFGTLTAVFYCICTAATYQKSVLNGGCKYERVYVWFLAPMVLENTRVPVSRSALLYAQNSRYAPLPLLYSQTSRYQYFRVHFYSTAAPLRAL